MFDEVYIPGTNKRQEEIEKKRREELKKVASSIQNIIGLKTQQSMRKHFWWISCAALILFISVIAWTPVKATKNTTTFKAVPPTAKELFAQYVNMIYQTARLAQTGMDESVFRKAITGFINLKVANMLPQNSSIITVVDLSKPSREKRMWIVDLVAKHLLINTWVAHGSGSGTATADYFSNTDDSHQANLD